MSEIAKNAGLNRESLYKALGETGNPEFSTVMLQRASFDDAAWRAWRVHWFTTGLQALERRLATEMATGAFAHGDSVTIADICLASDIAVARVFKIEAPDIPTVNCIIARCEQLEAFQRAEPSRLFGAPTAM